MNVNFKIRLPSDRGNDKPPATVVVIPGPKAEPAPQSSFVFPRNADRDITGYGNDIGNSISAYF